MTTEFAQQAQRKIDELVAQKLWMVTMVAPAVGDPLPHHIFAYTTGLTELFGHPEVFVCGLNGSTAHALLNNVGDAIAKGARLLDGSESFNVISGPSPVKFLDLPLEAVGVDGGMCNVRYGEDYDAVQMFWPDPHGLFPWEPGCDTAMSNGQCDKFGIGRSIAFGLGTRPN